MPDLAVILPAAGSSARFGQDKLSVHLDGISVLQRSLNAFLVRTDVKQIMVATSGSLKHRTDDARVHQCLGGKNRAESVWKAVQHVSTNIEWVAVHDAARPLVSQALIDRTFQAAIEHGAAVPALSVHLTIKQASGPLPARVERTIPRQNLWAMQTPQIMRRETLLKAFESCPFPLDQVTDDAQLLELAGHEVFLVQGEELNMKITTPTDLLLAQLHLQKSNES